MMQQKATLIPFIDGHIKVSATIDKKDTRLTWIVLKTTKGQRSDLHLSLQCSVQSPLPAWPLPSSILSHTSHVHYWSTICVCSAAHALQTPRKPSSQLLLHPVKSHSPFRSLFNHFLIKALPDQVSSLFTHLQELCVPFFPDIYHAFQSFCSRRTGNASF